MGQSVAGDSSGAYGRSGRTSSLTVNGPGDDVLPPNDLHGPAWQAEFTIGAWGRSLDPPRWGRSTDPLAAWRQAWQATMAGNGNKDTTGSSVGSRGCPASKSSDEDGNRVLLSW